jgi:hypothetical protein
VRQCGLTRTDPGQSRPEPSDLDPMALDKRKCDGGERPAASGGAPASCADLELGSSVLSAGGTRMTRMTRATDLGHQDGRSGNGDGVWPCKAESRGGAISGERAQPKQNAST